MQGLLSLTAASSGAIKAVVLFPSHHPVTCLHRLVSVLGIEIYSRGQSTGWMCSRHKGGFGCWGNMWEGGGHWDCGENRVSCGASPVAWLQNYELLTAFNSEIIIACGSFITTGRQKVKTEQPHTEQRR